MSKEQQQGGRPSFDDIPPYERIMRERAAAAAKEKEAAAQAAAQDAKSDQESRGQWATRPMAAQTATAAKRPQRKDDDHPATLAEAAAKRAEARQKAAQAAKARQAAMQAEREAQLAEEAARKAEAASAPQAQAVASEAQDVRADKAAEEAAAAKTAEAAEPAPKTKRPAPVAASKKEKKSRARREEPAKRGRHHRRRFPWVAVIMLVCIAVVVLAVTQIGRNWLVPANANDTQIVEVEIPEGTPVSTMGDILEEQGLIRSSSAFSLLVRVQGAAANLQAGVHDLSPSMTMPEIVAALQEGAEEAGLLKVTVNEGLTVDQIAEVVADSTSYSAEDFLNLMSNQEFLAQLVQQYPILTDSYNNPNVRYVLEGYLFPATYDVAQGETLESLVTQMVDKTNEVLSKYQADIDASSYSLQDIMSIASLVEKEGQTTEDRKLIAGVFYNRLEQGMPIQSDISVLYALGTHKEMVTYDDLEVDSPYNLYTNAGLPPGPMNSPSEDAIAAALEPTDNDYLYFYANLKTGEVFYTDDYEQHQAWAQEYEETGDIQG